MRYIVFSRMFVAIASKLLGIPVAGYVDDFAYVYPISLGPEAMEAFQQLSDIFGVKMKRKHPFNRRAFFSVSRDLCPKDPTERSFPLGPPSEKAEKWSSMLKTFLTADAIERAWMGKMIGRWSFAQSAVSDRFARSLL